MISTISINHLRLLLFFVSDIRNHALLYLTENVPAVIPRVAYLRLRDHCHYSESIPRQCLDATEDNFIKAGKRGPHL
jgi:hypothetical protein